MTERSYWMNGNKLTYKNSKEFSSLGVKLIAVSLSTFKSLIIRFVILILFSKIAFLKISYSVVSLSYSAASAKKRVWKKSLKKLHH